MSQYPGHDALALTAQKVKALSRDGAVPSPCVSVCQMHDREGLCRGCLRTIDEIARWGSAGGAYQRQIWALIEKRLELLEP